MMRKKVWKGFLCLALLALAFSCFAQEAYFEVDGKIASFKAEKGFGDAIELQEEVGRYFGIRAGDGRLLAGLGKVVINSRDEVTETMKLALIEPESGKTEIITDDVVRACPAPKGDAIAVIPKSFSLQLYANGELRDLGIEEKALQVAWFPDGIRFVIAAYPADWTSQKMNNPESESEFLRLSNADLFIYNIKTGEKTPLVIHPELDYNPVVSPDGSSIMFVSTRTHYASFYIIDADGKNLRQLTNSEPEKNRGNLVPVPLLDKIIWPEWSEAIFYETNAKDLSPQVRAIGQEGTNPRKIGEGRQIQSLSEGRIVFLDESGSPKVLSVGSEK